MKKLVLSVANLALCSLLIACPAMAEEAKRGAVTNLPIPRFVSLKASKGNVRRGPSLTHRIDWILKLRNMPLQVVAEHGHWRKVLDFEGAHELLESPSTRLPTRSRGKARYDKRHALKEKQQEREMDRAMRHKGRV